MQSKFTTIFFSYSISFITFKTIVCVVGVSNIIPKMPLDFSQVVMYIICAITRIPVHINFFTPYNSNPEILQYNAIHKEELGGIKERIRKKWVKTEE